MHVHMHAACIQCGIHKCAHVDACVYTKLPTICTCLCQTYTTSKLGLNVCDYPRTGAEGWYSGVRADLNPKPQTLNSSFRVRFHYPYI